MTSGRWAKRPEQRIILDIDNPTRAQTKKAMDHFFRKESGLFLPESSQYHGWCAGGCRRELYNLKTEVYFGQVFCVDCVNKMKAGER